MARNFSSNNFHFRPTSLAAAMQSAGLIDKPSLVREPKQSITKTSKEGDKWLAERMLPVRRVA